ncbi:Uncharacterised protein [Yersinia pseudotuberculosis]|nr:Uncharacterised protein [Yersinia pseudotuberculosis]
MDGIQLTVHGCDGMAIIFFIGSLKFGLQLAIFAVTVDNILYRRDIQCRGFLINPGQCPVIGKCDIAPIGAQFAFEQRQQSRFTTTVLANQADFLTGVNRSCGVVQQDASTTSNLKRGKNNHRVPHV